MANKVLLTMTDDIIHLPHPSHTYTHVQLYTYAYIRVCVCMYIYIYIYVYIYGLAPDVFSCALFTPALKFLMLLHRLPIYSPPRLFSFAALL